MEKTLNETKEELIRKNEFIKHNIEDQITVLKDDAAKIGKIALVAGGVILLTYLLVRGKKKPKNKKIIQVDGNKYSLATSADSEPFIVKQIRRYMIIFLASLAKQKLASYLQKINNNNTLEANTTKTSGLQEKWS
jgi:hypothetical protein